MKLIDAIIQGIIQDLLNFCPFQARVIWHFISTTSAHRTNQDCFLGNASPWHAACNFHRFSQDIIALIKERV